MKAITVVRRTVVRRTLVQAKIVFVWLRLDGAKAIPSSSFIRYALYYIRARCWMQVQRAYVARQSKKPASQEMINHHNCQEIYSQTNCAYSVIA